MVLTGRQAGDAEQRCPVATGAPHRQRHRCAASGGTVVGTAADSSPEIARRPEVVGPREMRRRPDGVGVGRRRHSMASGIRPVLA